MEICDLAEEEAGGGERAHGLQIYLTTSLRRHGVARKL